MKIAILTTDDRECRKDYNCPAPYFGAAPEALLQGFAQLPELEVHVLSCVRKPVQSPEKIAPNIHYHSLLVPKIGWMTTAYQGCIRAMRKKLREIQPDIVHGQGTEYDNAICAVWSGFPNVVTIHGNMGELARLFGARIGSFHWLAARLEDFALPRTAGVFCNSDYTASLVAPRARKTWLVPNAIRQQFFESEPGSAPAGVPILLNVGVISPRKRHLELLVMAKELHRRGCRFQLHFIGAMNPNVGYGALFHTELEEAKAAGYASYLGTKDVAGLIGCMDASSALIHFPNEEAFGLVVAEAMARNLKFFGAKLGGIVNIATGVEGAELIEADRWDALCDSITSWLAAGAPRATDAATAMRARYHPRVVANRHIEIYREVLQSAS